MTPLPDQRPFGNRWLLLYVAGLLVLIIASNSGSLEWIADNVLGMSWSAPIAKFIRSQTQGLVVILLITILFDLSSRRDRLHMARQNAALESQVSRLGSSIEALETLGSLADVRRESIGNALALQYGSEGSQVANLVLSGFAPCHDCEVLLDVREELDPVTYAPRPWITLSTSYTCPVDRFLIGVTSDSRMACRIMLEYGEVAEIAVPTGRDGDFLPQVSVSGDRGEPRLLNLSRLDRAAQAQLLGTDFPEDVELYGCPDSILGKRVNVRSDFPIALEDGHCFWRADRPTFVRKVVLRVQDPDRYGHMTVQPFLPGTSRFAVVDQGQGLYTVEIAGWLLAGHGVCFVW